jgi:hypothetical protein
VTIYMEPAGCRQQEIYFQSGSAVEREMCAKFGEAMLR